MTAKTDSAVTPIPHTYLVECVEGMVSFYDITAMEWTHFASRNVLITVPLRLQTHRVRRSMSNFEDVNGLVGMGFLHKIYSDPHGRDDSRSRLLLSADPHPDGRHGDTAK